MRKNGLENFVRSDDPLKWWESTWEKIKPLQQLNMYVLN